MSANPSECQCDRTGSFSARTDGDGKIVRLRTLRRAKPGGTWKKSARSLTKLTKKQTDYLGVPVDAPYKPERYRY